MEDAWVDEDGFWITKDRTLVRRPEIQGGRFDLSLVVASVGGTFDGAEWLSYSKNSFEFLGIHNSDCNVDPTFDRFSCSQGPLASNDNINTIEFNVFPNPSANGMVNIEADETIKSIELYDVVGQLIQTVTNVNHAAINNLELGSSLRGIYTLKVNFSEGQFSIRQIVIQ